MASAFSLREKFPKAGEWAVSRFRPRKTTVWQDMALCIAITLATSFYQFENYQPMMDAMRVFLAVLFLLVWLSLSFLNGRRGRMPFLFFSLAYWLLPQLAMVWQDRIVGTLQYSKWVDGAGKFARLLVEYPFKGMENQLDGKISSVVMMAVTLSLCVLLFQVGFDLHRRSVESR